VNADLGLLVARFRALSGHLAVPTTKLTYLTSQTCAQIARVTGASVSVRATETGCVVRFSGRGAAAASTMLRRQMGSVTGEIIADVTDTIREDLT
jgi:hypothetical protein